MKKLLLLFPILFLQSCSLQQDKAALDCQITFGKGTKQDIKNNTKDSFILVVDYKNQVMSAINSDISIKLLNPSFGPNKLSFQAPGIEDPTKPFQGDVVFIDRHTLKISGTDSFPYFGSCKKTNLPNLSGSGKQI